MSLSFLIDIEQYDSVTKLQLSNVVAISDVAHSHLAVESHQIDQEHYTSTPHYLQSLGERYKASVHGQQPKGWQKDSCLIPPILRLVELRCFEKSLVV